MTATPLRVSWWAPVLMAGLLVGAIGMERLPLDRHEVYVASSAQHMLETGDWVVPSFHGQPRLNKPPMSYWLAAIAARATDSQRVHAWHARIPSVLGGLVLIVGTMLLAGWLFDPVTARLAGWLIATSGGYFVYTHSARPDMLYAGLCVLGLAIGVMAVDAARPRTAAFGMWIAWALATLTKGPHVPAMFLVPLLLFGRWRANGWREAIVRVRPIAGPMVLVAIALPWWVALHYTLGSEALRGSQIEGSLFGFDARQLLSTYYLLHPIRFFAPWFALFALIPWLWRDGSDLRSAQVLLVLIVVVPALAFSVGVQHRAHYMLPSLPAAFVLLARAAIRAYHVSAAREGLRRVLDTVAPAHWLLLGTAIVVLLIVDVVTGAETLATASLGAVAVLGAGAGARLLRRAAPAASAPWEVVAVGMVGFFVALGPSPWLWGSLRYQDARLGHAVQRLVSPETPVVVLSLSAVPIEYYAGRRIAEARDVPELLDALDRSPGGDLAAVVRVASERHFPPDLHVETLMAAEGTRKPRLMLIRIRRSSDVAQPALSTFNRASVPEAANRSRSAA